MDTDLKDKHVVVTGASGGIGFEVVKQFLSEGGKVTAAYNTSERNLSKLKQNWPDSIITIKADIRGRCERGFQEGRRNIRESRYSCS